MKGNIFSETELRLFNEALQSKHLETKVSEAAKSILGEVEDLKVKIPGHENPLEQLVHHIFGIANALSKHQVMAELHAKVMRSALDAVLSGLSEQSYRMVSRKLKALKLEDVTS